MVVVVELGGGTRRGKRSHTLIIHLPSIKSKVSTRQRHSQSRWPVYIMIYTSYKWQVFWGLAYLKAGRQPFWQPLAKRHIYNRQEPKSKWMEKAGTRTKRKKGEERLSVHPSTQIFLPLITYQFSCTPCRAISHIFRRFTYDVKLGWTNVV